MDSLGPGVDPKYLGQRCVAYNVLKDGGEVGFEHPGGYAEFFLTEAGNLQVLAGDFPLSRAALIEPLAVCVRGMKRLGMRDKSSCLVFGDGPIGFLMLMLLKRQGLKNVCLVGGRRERLELAGELGAGQTLNYHELKGDLAREINKRCGARFANVIESSGSAAALKASIELVQTAGKILVIGDYGTSCADFPWNDLLHQEMELIGSNASAGAWPEAVSLATANTLSLDRLITHKLPASQWLEAVELVRGKRENVFKVVLEW